MMCESSVMPSLRTPFECYPYILLDSTSCCFTTDRGSEASS